jgi:hypothetical protein
MTTTTPESRGRIAFIAYCRARYGVEGALRMPMFDQLPDEERAGWMKAADVLWTLATTGRATL